MTARGGYRWSWWVAEKKVFGFGWVFGDDESEKNCVFHTEEHIYNL